jgi:diguanylate cyclase (GGDEF)-like protein/putative nucleotidyltransferase with HDIG domain
MSDLPGLWQYVLPYGAVTLAAATVMLMFNMRANDWVATAALLLGGIVIELGLVQQVLVYRRVRAHRRRSTRLETLADVDPVTGLPNHRALVSLVEREIARSQRYEHACSVLFLDLDHFKTLNDTFGHHAGDRALQEFGALLRSTLRETDSVGRWGGEEFLACLPETDAQAAWSIAERVRSAVADHGFWAAGGAHLTCSIGVATYPQDAGHWDEVIKLADHAMYAAKKRGRDCTHRAGAPHAGTGDSEIAAGGREDAELLGVLGALSVLMKQRDPATAKHSNAVAALGVQVARAMNCGDVEEQVVWLAGHLHDVGKLAVPDAILWKPGDLTGEEWGTIRRHTEMGAQAVSCVPSLRILAPIIRAHHERWDGRGYPDHLRGPEIPLAARILAVADAYVAMRADRPYRPALSETEALDELRRCSGAQFDPETVVALIRVLMSGEQPQCGAALKERPDHGTEGEFGSLAPTG